MEPSLRVRSSSASFYRKTDPDGEANHDSERPRDLHAPCQRLVESAAELQVVGGVDDAVAVEVEEYLIAAAGRLVKGAAEGEVVASVDDGGEIGPRRAAKRRDRQAGVAEQAMDDGRRVRRHADA